MSEGPGPKKKKVVEEDPESGSKWKKVDEKVKLWLEKRGMRFWDLGMFYHGECLIQGFLNNLEW